MSDIEWIIIKEERNEQDARIVQGFLQSRGIDCEINEDDAGDQLPSLEESQGVQILVKSADVEEAKKLLREKEVDQSPDLGGES